MAEKAKETQTHITDLKSDLAQTKDMMSKLQADFND